MQTFSGPSRIGRAVVFALVFVTLGLSTAHAGGLRIVPGDPTFDGPSCCMAL